MIISDEYKFIFVHVPKVAGTSISKTIMKYGIREVQFTKHIPATDLRIYLGEERFNSYYKFAFVRNPWDWLVSNYSFTKQKDYVFNNHIVRIFSFEDYLDWFFKEDNKIRQLDFLVDENGKVLVDFIGTFDNIGADFEKICKTIGIKENLLHINTSNHDNYRKYYTKNTQQRVAEEFSELIAKFDFKF